jgi:hypothetical protein
MQEFSRRIQWMLIPVCVLQADCPDRTVPGNWYTAVPPLAGKTGLTPADYFGRALVANLPKMSGGSSMWQ